MAYDKFYVSSHPGSGSGLSFGFTVDGGIGGIVTYVLSGQILDSAGAGLDGVTITLSGDGEGTTETAGGGFFAIAVPDGNYTVTPTLGGGTFSPTSRAAVVDGANLNLSSMQQTWVISGAITGDEVEGVTITLTGDASDSTTSAADGTYSFTGLLDGDYTLTPTLAGHIFGPETDAITISGANDTSDFVSTAIFTISGTITGDVVENVTVTLSGDASDSAVTGSSGAYSFSGLADGSYTVTPSLAGYGFTPAATNVTVSGADQTGQDFVSALLVYDISGAITGDEVSGVTVTLSGDDDDSAVTGVGGTFTFADLPPGDYTLTPTLAGYTFAPASTNVTIVAADQTDQDFVSTLITYTISGTITGDEDEGVTVALTGDATDSTTSAADGTYSFTGVVDGSYTVTPTLDGYEFTPASASVTVSGADDTGNDFVSAAALLGDDFQSYPVGGLPAAWTKISTAGTWTLEEEGGGNRFVRAKASGGNDRTFAISSAMGEHTDLVAQVKMRFHVANFSGGGLAFRCTGSGATLKAIGLELRIDYNQFIVRRFTSATAEASFDTAGTGGVTPRNDGHWYYLKGKIEGTGLYGKCWRDDGVEPVDWVFILSQSNILTPGGIALFGYSRNQIAAHVTFDDLLLP